MKNRFTSSQRGYASLTIGVILLLILSLMSLYLARSGVLDLRTSANRARQAQAQASAERQLELAVSWFYLSANRSTLSNFSAWPTCNTLTTTPYSALGSNLHCQALNLTLPNGNVSAMLSTPTSSKLRGKVFFVSSRGTSDDGSAETLVKQGLYFYDPSGGELTNIPPMMGAGNVPLNGTFDVVANPNGGGTGVPVSIWSRVPIDAPQGSSKTCQLYEYQRDGGCDSSIAMSFKDVKGPDIVDYANSVSPFPSDMFKYIFGFDANDYESVKKQSTVISDCSNLSNAKGIVWVNTGINCTVSGSNGSETNPLILVVEKGNFTMNANATFYGLLFAFGPDGDAGTITANGGAKFYGAMLSNDTTTMGININGTFHMVYNPAAMQALEDPGNIGTRIVTRLPSSWTDYLSGFTN